MTASLIVESHILKFYIKLAARTLSSRLDIGIYTKFKYLFILTRS